ncbi:MAG: hypothetical protein WD382_03875 [Halofilum sp. (in: g-proteobacteria)]
MVRDSYQATFEQGKQAEAERIAFLERERGIEEAVAFARRTGTAYRRAVVARSPPAGDPAFRLRLMASYCYFKAYLASQ